MGENVLNHPGVVPGRPSSAIVRGGAAFLILALVGVAAAAAAVAAAEPNDLAIKILKGLNMTRIPHLNQMRSNVSQIEFETKHREYFDLVERNQRRRLNQTLNYDEESIVRKKLFRFTHSGLEISRVRNLEKLNYDVNIPVETNEIVEVEESSIRLLIVPRICIGGDRLLTIRAIESNRSSIIGESIFDLPNCRARWISIDLTDGGPISGADNFQVTLVCANCVPGELDTLERHLNVIAAFRARSRIRRDGGRQAGRRRSWRSRTCDKFPLVVNFSTIPGYQYIIQPRTTNVGFCAGKCPVRWKLSQHAIFQIYAAQNNASIPRPCCAPSKMRTVEYLFLNENDPSKLKVGFWNDTIVDECKCN